MTVPLDKNFELQTSKTFCMLSWIHAHADTRGNAKPCCIAKDAANYGSLRESSLPDLLNASAFRELRQRMLAGIPSPDCATCYSAEALGERSLRQERNEQFASDFDVVERIEAGNPISPGDLRYLDLRFSSLCNLRCRTCSSEASSGWNQDMTLLYGERFFAETFRPTGTSEEFIDQLAPMLPGVRRIYFAGGEPLLDDDHYSFLERLIVERRTDIQLVYNTNFSRLRTARHSATRIWAHFPSVQVFASLDDVGDRAEYTRKGTNWRQIATNHSTLRREAPHVEFMVQTTVSVFNIFYLTRAIRRFIEDGLLEHGRNFFVNLVNSPEIFSIQILNASERERIAADFATFQDLYLSRSPVSESSLISVQLERVSRFLLGESHEQNRKSFIHASQIIDRIRGESLIATLPELWSLFAT